MLFAKPITAGLLLVALSSLATRAGARAIELRGRSNVPTTITHCTVTDRLGNCLLQYVPVDAPGVGKSKRGVVKVGGKGDGIGGPSRDGDVEETGAGSTAGIGGLPGGGSSESGGTAQISGVADEAPTAPSKSNGDSETFDAITGTKSPSDAGSADSRATVGSQSTSDEDFPQDVGRAAPIPITQRGYVAVRDPGNQNIIRITHPEVDTGTSDLDTLEVDVTDNSMGVILAQNGKDLTADKLPLRKILGDTWVQFSGKEIKDLEGINYQLVTNDEMLDAMSKMYRDLGKDFDDAGRGTENFIQPESIIITKEANPDAFQTIMDTTFGFGANKFLGETAGLEGRQITSISMFPRDEDGFVQTDVQFNFPATS
jgi:hypothetical protein